MDSEQLKRHWDAAAIPPTGWDGHLYFNSNTNHKIRYGHAPAIGKTTGTVVLTHGYGEHIDIYYETIKNYQQRGYEVFAMDWHGHGKSSRDNPADPQRPSSAGMSRHTKDFHQFIEDIVQPSRHENSKELIMSTNSMGGHIGLMYLKEHDDVFDAAIMSTPMFDITRKGLPEAFRPAIKSVFNALARIGLRQWQVPTADKMSHEKFSRRSKKFKEMKMIDWSGENIRSYIADLIRAFHPDSRLGEPTIGWIASTFNSVSKTMKEDYLKTIKTPILIGSAGNETLVDNKAHKKVAQHAQNAELFELPTASHVLWLETDENHNAWWNRIDDFLTKYVHGPKLTLFNNEEMPGRSPANENDEKKSAFNGFTPQHHRPAA